MNKEKGSGVLRTSLKLQSALREGFALEISKLVNRKLLTKKQQGDMIAGFADGVSSTLRALQEMGVISMMIDDNRPEDPSG